MKKTDIVIIGAGAVGSALARELSKYKLDVTVVEKNSDVGGDASKSNSAIIHTGYDAKPGTLESRLVVAANPMYDEICKDLDVPFKRIGAILPAFNDEQLEQLPAIKHKAVENRVYDVEYKTPAELLEMEVCSVLLMFFVRICYFKALSKNDFSKVILKLFAFKKVKQT